MQAFRSSHLPLHRHHCYRAPAICATPPPSSSPDSQKPLSSRPHRKNSSAGFDPTRASSDKRTSQEKESPPRVPNLQKPDANGITLEQRLREEIKHPLRKPKQTLFATLSFSAGVGLFFALGRLAAAKDQPLTAANNIFIDLVAILLFGRLTYSQVEFGRRALNSIALRPEARDLPLVPLQNSVPFLPKHRVSTLLRAADVVVAAGRGVDVLAYLKRGGGDSVEVVAFPTDGGKVTELGNVADGVAVTEGEGMADWIAWLGDAVPPRKNISLFRVGKGTGKGAASSFVVAVDTPQDLPLPMEARKQEVVDV